MDTTNMIINVIAILAGLTMYIGIMNSKWGKAHEGIQYFIMLITILLAVLLGGFIRWLM
ncbi:MAG: hypothetical protein K6F66_01515 [Pseudobutyrivibrio sp.]|nr:hypothetical protein [Pseudobutyrivibrio sp.]